VNHQIRVPKIRVVTDDGEMLGVMAPRDALREAQNRGLDLVEISPKAVPPVCKIMDYGKFKYEAKKKETAQKKANTQAGNIIKEVTLSPQTDTHDLNTKMKKCVGFLENGNRVKVTVRFRGREMAHPDIGAEQLRKVVKALDEHGMVEGTPKMEGRFLMVMFTPPTQGAKKTGKPYDFDEALKRATSKLSRAPFRRPPQRRR
jgi:translation initiation factor IF-3